MTLEQNFETAREFRLSDYLLESFTGQRNSPKEGAYKLCVWISVSEETSSHRWTQRGNIDWISKGPLSLCKDLTFFLSGKRSHCSV